MECTHVLWEEAWGVGTKFLIESSYFIWPRYNRGSDLVSRFVSSIIYYVCIKYGSGSDQWVSWSVPRRLAELNLYFDRRLKMKTGWCCLSTRLNRYVREIDSHEFRKKEYSFFKFSHFWEISGRKDSLVVLRKKKAFWAVEGLQRK